ncbi:uncharacterized protein BHQ10_003586 [Talaromyces amestolkiae]|uniref:F-box domain-containing protein n=1 Tax=Talaromyces amestolkiae TaxID=1196081 RepID=A0A364KVK3_TALAM|nr:uncharacterized protein BHQ10_003586 [Talaromyces amestolkiae]RAO67574.1 hypothetical protein BHQ10_003586 [Talaromyces amestolkiae]
MVLIQNLPVELLRQIFESLTDFEEEPLDLPIRGDNANDATEDKLGKNDSGDDGNDDDFDKLKDLRSVCLVSQFFRELAQPLLFRDFDEDGLSGSMAKIVSFTRSLYRNAELGKHVQRISIMNPLALGPFHVDIEDEDSELFNDAILKLRLADQEQRVWVAATQKSDLSVYIALIVNKTPNLRQLCLPGGEFSMKPIIQLFAQNPSLLPNLELLWIDADDESAGYPIMAYEEVLTRPKLANANFEYGDLDDDMFPASWTPRTLAMEELAFHHCYIDAKALPKLLQACKTLKSFGYDNFGLDPRDHRTPTSKDVPEFNATQAHEALLGHKDTLEHFHLAFAWEPWDVENIAEYVSNKVKIGSFRDFSVLETVVISHELLPPHPQFPPSLKTLHITNCNLSIRDMAKNIANDCKKDLYPNLTDFMVLAADITRPIKLSGQVIPPGQTPEQCFLSLKNMFNGTKVDFRICPYKLPDFDDEPDESDESDFDYEDDDEFMEAHGQGPSQFAGLLHMIMQHSLEDPESVPKGFFATSDNSWETESDG